MCVLGEHVVSCVQLLHIFEGETQEQHKNHPLCRSTISLKKRWSANYYGGSSKYMVHYMTLTGVISTPKIPITDGTAHLTGYYKDCLQAQH